MKITYPFLCLKIKLIFKNKYNDEGRPLLAANVGDVLNDAKTIELSRKLRC